MCEREDKKQEQCAVREEFELSFTWSILYRTPWAHASYERCRAAHGGGDQTFGELADIVALRILPSADIGLYFSHQKLAEEQSVGYAVFLSYWNSYPPVKSYPAGEKQDNENNQNDADDTDATVTKTVAVTAETATETTEQEDDKDDDKYESERHDRLSIYRV
jgi:hypothetical protein